MGGLLAGHYIRKHVRTANMDRVWVLFRERLIRCGPVVTPNMRTIQNSGTTAPYSWVLSSTSEAECEVLLGVIGRALIDSGRALGIGTGQYEVGSVLRCLGCVTGCCTYCSNARGNEEVVWRAMTG